MTVTYHRDKKEEPMKNNESPENIMLDELSEMILSDCRKLGADEKKITSIKKSILVKTPVSDTSEGYHFTYNQETHSYWLDYFEKGKASGGIEDISPLNFRFKFVCDFIFCNPQKNFENKEKWETFLKQTYDCFSTAADYQMTVQECLWKIPGFSSPEPYKPCLSWMGNAIPVGSEQTQTSNKEELYKLGVYHPRLLTHYKGELYTMAEDNSSAQWRDWNRGEIMLYRADKGFMHVPINELEDVLAASFEVRLSDREDWFPVTSVWRPRAQAVAPYDPKTEVCCLIADPEYKLPLHTPASERTYGVLLQIDLNQVAEVRLWLGTPVIDLLKTTPQSIQNTGEKGIDAQEHFQDKSSSATPDWIPGSFLSDFTTPEDYQNSVVRKGSVLVWKTMISVELDQVRDSSLQELLALWGGTGDTRLIAKYHNSLYSPYPSGDKIELWRDGIQANTVSLNEIDEIDAIQFEVQYQGEWFLCFGIGAIEYDDGSHDCLLADPEYKLPLHTQHSHYMWGDGVEINSSQIEAVRMWQGLLPIDIIAQRKDDI